MTATHTVPERLAILVCALASFAVAAFVTARVYPVRHLLTRTEAQSAIGLLLSAALLTLGVSLIVDWRRKRRAKWKPKYFTQKHLGVAWDPLFYDKHEPATELSRHLTAALAVLLREPSLTIDAGTMRMLAKHKERRPVKRDEKGRWRRVQ